MINTNDRIINNLNKINKYNMPLYIYDYETISDRCNKLQEFKDNLSKELNIRISMHYSTKANNNPILIKIIKEHGLMIDAMSPLELDIALKCNYKNNEIIYVSNNIDTEEMKHIHDNNILICLDSLSQIEDWGKMFNNSNIMIRLNPGIEGVGHNNKVITSGNNTKFGITENNIPELKEIIDKYELNIVGVHLHLGSLFLNDKIDDYITGIKKYIEIINKYFKEVEIIDFGGGFGVPYKENENDLDFNQLERKIASIIKDNLQCNNIKEIMFEPGRYVICEGGLILGKVTSIKTINNKKYIGTNIGMNILIRPELYDAYHKIDFIYNNGEGNQETVDIVGNICESGDVLARERNIKLPKINDYVIVYNTGAYGYSMSSNYTGRLRGPELLLKNNEVYIIRKEDTIESLEKNMIFNL